MATMKKFKRYFINFIVLYLIVSGLVWLCTKDLVNDIEYTIEDNESYEIIITKCKAGKMKSNIKGTITNTTNEIKDNISIIFNIYNKEDKKIGEEEYIIENLTATGTCNFEREFKYTDIKKIEIKIK